MNKANEQKGIDPNRSNTGTGIDDDCKLSSLDQANEQNNMKAIEKNIISAFKLERVSETAGSTPTIVTRGLT